MYCSDVIRMYNAHKGSFRHSGVDPCRGVLDTRTIGVERPQEIGLGLRLVSGEPIKGSKLDKERNLKSTVVPPKSYTLSCFVDTAAWVGKIQRHCFESRMDESEMCEFDRLRQRLLLGASAMSPKPRTKLAHAMLSCSDPQCGSRQVICQEQLRRFKAENSKQQLN